MIQKIFNLFIILISLTLLLVPIQLQAKGSPMSQQNKYDKIIIRQGDKIIFEMKDSQTIQNFVTVWSQKKQIPIEGLEHLNGDSEAKAEWDYQIVFYDAKKNSIWLYNSKSQIAALLSKSSHYYKLPKEFDLLGYK